MSENVTTSKMFDKKVKNCRLDICDITAVISVVRVIFVWVIRFLCVATKSAKNFMILAKANMTLNLINHQNYKNFTFGKWTKTSVQ